MSKPKRIQRKRTKGWKMPANTIYVGRPTKWGNDFHVVQSGDTWEVWDKTAGKPHLVRLRTRREAINKAITLFNINQKPYQWDLSELKGKNLACWCPLDQPCHADFLLRLANK